MKLIIIGLIILILIGGGYYIYENTEIDSEEITIKNPATGEVWDSIEEYVYRNSNEVGVDNG